MARHGFKAIFVGSGVAGLALANILEQLGIGFIVFESHGEWVLHVGASIAILPNSMHILNELGFKNGFGESVLLIKSGIIMPDSKPIFTAAVYICTFAYIFFLFTPLSFSGTFFNLF